MRLPILIAFDVGRTLPNTDLSRDFMGLVMGQWFLGRTSGIPRRFFLQGRMTSQRERAWNRDHRTHSLIFDYC